MSILPSTDQLETPVFGAITPRAGDIRNNYQRERARIIHSAAFRRLQGKTQVMGIGEGDFHRTRLTHSIEVAQIGEGILNVLKQRHYAQAHILEWLPDRELLASACYAHDLGHPPFGHAGEMALQSRMSSHFGFEGNAQTLRIISNLEKYTDNKGINPSKRLVLAVLKYPVPYSKSAIDAWAPKPPKCFYDLEIDIVTAALSDFPPNDVREVQKLSETNKPKPLIRSLDAAIMELADDIAYGVHDLEDIIGRKLASKDEIDNLLSELFSATKVLKSDPAGDGSDTITKEELIRDLFGSSAQRKSAIGRLVNLFITSAKVVARDRIFHPLFRFTVEIPGDLRKALDFFSENITYKLVIANPKIAQLEHRGQRIITALFDELLSSPEKLIPKHSLETLQRNSNNERIVSDYIAGMTDPYAERIYHRLFTPGFGNSSDEL